MKIVVSARKWCYNSM